MNEQNNKIEAHHQNICEVLDRKKYTVDYFQREYNWKKKHIEDLITDLTLAFLNEYKEDHSRRDSLRYNSYYLGPFVISEEREKSIIDGQQRLTSLTLLLIYLNNLQKELKHKKKLKDEEDLTQMIFSSSHGEKSYNIDVPGRKRCLDKLYTEGSYELKDDDDQSTLNMVARYQDIVECFPEELKKDNLLNFIDWLMYKVVMVKITAYVKDNAYKIFETMNDRGLSLTPSEMLKGFILSHIKEQDREEANQIWKKIMQNIVSIDKKNDQQFFQSWLRAQYADTIRSGEEGAENQDFEDIGTRLHNWVRDHLSQIGLDQDREESFENFTRESLQFYFKYYKLIRKAEQTFNSDLEHIFYQNYRGIAETLRYPLMLAPLNVGDADSIACEKIDTVARYIETFTVRRLINRRTVAASSIRYTMYNLVREIRGKDIDELKRILGEKIAEMKEETFDGMDEFRLFRRNGNKPFVKFLLSRMTSWVEQEAGMRSSFEDYIKSKSRKNKPFEIEHIWADQYERHKEEFDQEADFEEYRNRIGGLVLLPQGTNQSHSDDSYEKKFKKYIRENLLAQSLCPEAYEKNPNFTRLRDTLGLPFEPHHSFKKSDIDARQQLYKKICERIWDWNS